MGRIVLGVLLIVAYVGGFFGNPPDTFFYIVGGGLMFLVPGCGLIWWGWRARGRKSLPQARTETSSTVIGTPHPSPTRVTNAGVLPTSSAAKRLQGVLALSPRPLNNAQQLLQQIVDEQKAMGHAVAPGFVATTHVGDPADQWYVYALIRTTFESFGGADVIDRTTVKTFQASDGNSGSYFLLFDRA